MTEQLLPKVKKSVALSGTAAGNTAICTVGRTGNDLHYRGYDILDFADKAEFEEIAYLLIHGTLPTRAQLNSYKAKLRSLRGLPQAVKQALEAIPPTAHPMDVMRTGCLPAPPFRVCGVTPHIGLRHIEDQPPITDIGEGESQFVSQELS